MEQLYGGVETGGTWCVCGVGTGPSEIQRRTQFRTTTPEETIAKIISFFSQDPKPVAVGIGAFGPIDVDPASPTWGSITTTPKPGWRDTHLATRVRDSLELPVAFDQDVVASALAEYCWGIARDAPSVCYVTVGTGVGAGILIDGQPWHGLVHPEVGHIRIPHDKSLDPFPGICPAHGGCWEGLASGPAIEARWSCSAEALDDVHPAWELEANYVALGTMAIVAVLSPHVIVLGGGVMERKGLLERVRAGLRALVNEYLATPLLAGRIGELLVAPSLGDDAGVLGAIALARRLLESPS